YGLAAIAGSMLAVNTGLPLNSHTNLLMILRGIVLPSLSLRWPDSMTWGNSVLISMASPFFASFGILSRGFSAMIVSRFFSLSVQPPQPPMVTFTSFWLVKNSPLLVFATAMMFWVVARRMRVDASALPARGEKWKVATPGLGLPSATTRISLT